MKISTILSLALFAYFIYGNIVHTVLRGPQREYQILNQTQKIIITGSSSGIGKEAAREFANLNATVIFACKNKDQAINAIQEIQTETNNFNLYFLPLDLEKQESIEQFVQMYIAQFKTLNILINNAGIADYDNSDQKIDKIFQVNQLGWVHLTNLLINQFEDQGRIINIISHLYRWITEPINLEMAIQGQLSYRYAISKYSKASSSIYLQQLLKENNKNIKVALIAPGAVNTEIYTKSLKNHYILNFLYKIAQIIMYPILLHPNSAAQTYLYVSLMPWDELEEGGLYNFNRKGNIGETIQLLNQGQSIWEFSIQMNKIQQKQTQHKIRLQRTTKKASWPECLGKYVNEAVKIILNDDPKITIQIIPEGSPITLDYSFDRVRIFHNSLNIVTIIPQRG